jgi:hypothetical protein
VFDIFIKRIGERIKCFKCNGPHIAKKYQNNDQSSGQKTYSRSLLTVDPNLPDFDENEDDTTEQTNNNNINNLKKYDVSAVIILKIQITADTSRSEDAKNLGANDPLTY